MGHANDFLTIGGMGHTSQIAAGIAFVKPSQRILCIDGDGSLLMFWINGCKCIMFESCTYSYK